MVAPKTKCGGRGALVLLLNPHSFSSPTNLNHLKSICSLNKNTVLSPQAGCPGRCYSDFKVHIYYLGILLKCAQVPEWGSKALHS